MIIVLVGPTAVGKTKASIELAKKYNAIIINGDSTQVYKGMNIGTAKISEVETEQVPHYLIDTHEVTSYYSIYEYQKDVRSLIAKHKNKNIIIVGGSGLYIKAALYDYEFNEEKNAESYDALTNEELYKKALIKDKNMTIHLHNRKRLIRFLNKTETALNKGNNLLYNCLFIGLNAPREELYERINIRCDKQFEDGLLEEVRSFYDQKIRSRILLSAIGYKELYKYFDNEISLEEAKELIKKKTRQYVKRQLTWFNNKMNITWFNTDYLNFNNTVEKIKKFIDEQTMIN